MRPHGGGVGQCLPAALLDLIVVYFTDSWTEGFYFASDGFSSCALNFQGTIHPFRKTHRSIFGKLLQEFRLVSSDRRVSDETCRVLSGLWLFGLLSFSLSGDHLKDPHVIIPISWLDAVCHTPSPAQTPPVILFS